MQKIPSVFRRAVALGAPYTREVDDRCGWVLVGEGHATRKWDGTACAIINGKLYARYDAKRGKPAPAGGIACQPPDPVTGHWPHWVPVGDEPQYKWHVEAFRALLPWPVVDGTYELCGPMVGGNPEGLHQHALIRHGYGDAIDVERSFDGLRAYLERVAIEGIVFHHPDGRMAKVTRQGFGIPWRGPKGQRSAA